MTYSLGKQSQQKLIGVHPDLVAVVRSAITLTTQDFTVHEGVRTIETQREYVKRGASQTMASRHLKGSDGFGHAVDLYAWVNGVRWEWSLYEQIADAMRISAIKLNTPIRWGGGWLLLNDFKTLTALRAAQKAYVQERLAAGKKAFTDGPHFELPKSTRYPQ